MKAQSLCCHFSLGPKQNNIFQHLNAEKETLATFVTSEIQASETGVFSLSYGAELNSCEYSYLEPQCDRADYELELHHRQIHFQPCPKQFVLPKRLVKTHTRTISYKRYGPRNQRSDEIQYREL